MEAEAVSEDESSTMLGELSEVGCKNQDDSESLKRRLNKVSSELEAACNKLTRLERKLQAYLYEEEAFRNDDEMVVPTSGCANRIAGLGQMLFGLSGSTLPTEAAE